MKKHSLILALALVVNMAGCAGNTDTKPEPHKEDISITITAPSDENGPVTPGHSFFISGSITNDEALSEGTSLRVSVLDKDGKEVRFALSSRKDDDSIDRFTDAFFYYADDVDPKRSDVHAREFPCLIVEDTENPSAFSRIRTLTPLFLMPQIRRTDCSLTTGSAMWTSQEIPMTRFPKETTPPPQF